MSYWPPADGDLAMVDDSCYGSELVQHGLAAPTVVKTLNHIGYHELEVDRRPAGARHRGALGKHQRVHLTPASDGRQST